MEPLTIPKKNKNKKLYKKLEMNQKINSQRSRVFIDISNPTQGYIFHINKQKV